LARTLSSSSLDWPIEEGEKVSIFQHLLVMQAFSYVNSTFSIAAARAGDDDNKPWGLIGGSW
jgi:hypothetical protein